MRAAIYARYSTDLQSASSIEDQIRLCREWVEKENGAIVEIYSELRHQWQQRPQSTGHASTS